LDLLRDKLKHTNVPVWVVDNDSADESTSYLKTINWIHLIERKGKGLELGHIAHGRALNIVLEKVTTDYLFLLHTDTFVYDVSVFEMMLKKCKQNDRVIAVGCLEQMDRGILRSVWRFCSRFFKHYFRRFKITAGLASRPPKPYREKYLKSFCAVWNVSLIKKHGWSFLMSDEIPGYELQDRAIAAGYTIEYLSPRKLFSYLDHVQSGTVAAAGGYHQNHRRTKMYNAIINKAPKD
jgi:GT2 family glycosyltransferase